MLLSPTFRRDSVCPRSISTYCYVIVIDNNYLISLNVNYRDYVDHSAAMFVALTDTAVITPLRHVALRYQRDLRYTSRDVYVDIAMLINCYLLYNS